MSFVSRHHTVEVGALMRWGAEWLPPYKRPAEIIVKAE